jgi:hypothetical protein
MKPRVSIATCAKMFPWPKYTLNLAGVIAANFLPLIFIFAFLSTTVRVTITGMLSWVENYNVSS